MKSLPDCPACDASDTLEAVRTEGGRGVIVAVCSCCSVTVRVERNGYVSHQSEPKTDIMGHVIDGE